MSGKNHPILSPFIVGILSIKSSDVCFNLFFIMRLRQGFDKSAPKPYHAVGNDETRILTLTF